MATLTLNIALFVNKCCFNGIVIQIYIFICERYACLLFATNKSKVGYYATIVGKWKFKNYFNHNNKLEATKLISDC